MRRTVRALLVLLPALGSGSAAAQTPWPPVGRDVALGLEYPPIRFEPQGVQVEHVGPDVPVLFLRDPTLPLVTVFARFKGGYALFPRERYAVTTALAGLLRSGGTTALTPDSVDALVESLALQLSFGSGGEALTSSVNSLRSTLDDALALWADMLQHPRFDSTEIEVWRGREMESERRRRDDPRRLAFTEFNRLMYGDHPTGWEMDAEDLLPERLTPDRFRAVYREIVCAENLILGVTGDVSWEEARERVQAFVVGLERCPGPLPPSPEPVIRREPGVFLIPRGLDQSTIVMAHPTAVHLGDTDEYFASRIGNSILGSNGLSSRLASRVRTEEGLAYGASSLWTAPRDADGLLGAITQTRSESTVRGIRTLLEVLAEARTIAPDPADLSLAVDQAVNGFVFNFETTGQIVSREMLYLSEDMPEDWLDRYLRGIQRVDPQAVREVFARYLRPGDMTILVVGDPTRFDEPLDVLGDVTVLDPSTGEPAR